MKIFGTPIKFWGSPMKIRGSSKDISRNGRFLQGNNRPLPRISRSLKGRNRPLGRYLNFYKNKCVKGIFFYSFIIFTFPTPPLSPVWTFLGLKKRRTTGQGLFFYFFKCFCSEKYLVIFTQYFSSWPFHTPAILLLSTFGWMYR